MNLNILFLGFLWLSFFVLHSLLASHAVKERMMHWLGLSPRHYRFQYVVLSLVHLFIIFLVTWSTASSYIFQPTGLTRIFGLGLVLFGGVVCQQAFKSYDGKAFFGLADLKGEEQFKTDGLLRHVRHPLYSGSIMLLIGFLVYKPDYANLVSVILMIIYFIVGIRFEERKLIRSFGDKYLEYKSRTPMLIPRLWR